MSNYEDRPETVHVTLSPVESEKLFVFLTELTEAGALATGFSDLDQLLDKLGDANALALWMRENVNLELEGHEAAAVLGTLENTSPAESLSPETNQILRDVQNKLQKCLPEAHCVGNMN